MLLLGDETRDHGRVPWVTGSLIAINIVVFCGRSFSATASRSDSA